MSCPCHQQESSLRFDPCIKIKFIWYMFIYQKKIYMVHVTIIWKMSKKILLQETCLASKDAMPFDLLKKKLMSRLETMGIRIIRTYEEVIFLARSLCLIDSIALFSWLDAIEWSYFPFKTKTKILCMLFSLNIFQKRASFLCGCAISSY